MGFKWMFNKIPKRNVFKYFLWSHDSTLTAPSTITRHLLLLTLRWQRKLFGHGCCHWKIRQALGRRAGARLVVVPLAVPPAWSAWVPRPRPVAPRPLPVAGPPWPAARASWPAARASWPAARASWPAARASWPAARASWPAAGPLVWAWLTPVRSAVLQLRQRLPQRGRQGWQRRQVPQSWGHLPPEPPAGWHQKNLLMFATARTESQAARSRNLCRLKLGENNSIDLEVDLKAGNWPSMPYFGPVVPMSARNFHGKCCRLELPACASPGSS